MVLEGHNAAAEVLLQLVQGLVEVGFLVVELVDGEHHGDAGSLGVTPLDLSTHIDTVLGVDDHEGGVHHAECGNRLTNEVIEAGAVHHIDFGAVEFGVHNGAVDGLLSFEFHLAVVGEGVLVLHGASSADYAAVEGHSLAKRGFTRAVTADDGDVSDFFRLINFHWCIIN